MWYVRASMWLASGSEKTSQGGPSPAGTSRVTQLFHLPLRPSQNERELDRTLGQRPQPTPSPSLTGHAFSPLPTGALQIESSEETDQGKYECVATNSAGVRYSSPANLYVRGRERCVQVKGRDPSHPVPLPPQAHSLRAPLSPADPSRRAPAQSRQDLGPSGIPLRTSVSSPVNRGQLIPPSHPCACDGLPVGCRGGRWGWGGRAAGGERGRARVGESDLSLQGWGSLQASAPPCPPARVSFFCGVSCVPPFVMCSLCFSEIRGLVAPASPSPALQRPPSESWGGVFKAAPPPPAPAPSAELSPVLFLLAPLKKD